MKLETLTLGTLSLVGEIIPPLVALRTDATDPDQAPLYIKETEWHSLLALGDLQRAQALQLTRLRAALREALKMVHVGYEPVRLQVLHDFLDGKREGL